MISRRSFLLGTGAAAGALIVPELILPKRTSYFLPPAGGWRMDGTYKRYLGFDRIIVLGEGETTVCLPRECEMGATYTILNNGSRPAHILHGVDLSPKHMASLVKIQDGRWAVFARDGVAAAG